MNRDHLLIHLVDGCNCMVIKESHKGWTAVKNPVNGKKHAVPPNDPVRPSTAIIVCQRLEVAVPDALKEYCEKLQSIMNKGE